MPRAAKIQNTSPGTFIDTLRPQADLPVWGYNLGIVVVSAMIVALSAQFAIPMPWGVPITGQTFAVLLVGAALGPRLGAASMITYLGMGAAGLPVFAGGGFGAHVFLGPSAGYLVGFVLSAGLVGALAERGWDRSVLKTFVMMVLGTVAIFACGLAWAPAYMMLFNPPWLTEMDGATAFLGIFLLPYLPGAAIKIALAMIALPGAWALLGKRPS